MDTMTESETYQGWANRETWAFNLHWSNDEGFYNIVVDMARNILEEDAETTDYALGRHLSEWVDNELPYLSPELWENMRGDVGSFWRVDLEEVGASVRESLGNES